MPAEYTDAPEVAKVAGPIIHAHHRHLLENNVKVDFLFTSEAEKSKGKVALGTARKVSGLNAWLARRGDDYEGVPDFFLIVIWKTAWDDLLNDHQKRALVEHELCHLWSEEDEKADREEGDPPKIKLGIVGHDLEEFNRVVADYGGWQPDVKAFLLAAKQAGADAEEDRTQLRMVDMQGNGRGKAA